MAALASLLLTTGQLDNQASNARRPMGKLGGRICQVVAKLSSRLACSGTGTGARCSTICSKTSRANLKLGGTDERCVSEPGPHDTHEAVVMLKRRTCSVGFPFVQANADQRFK